MYPDDAANTKFLLLSPHLHKLNEKITITLLIKCFLFLAYCVFYLCCGKLIALGVRREVEEVHKKNKIASHFHVCAVNDISFFL